MTEEAIDKKMRQAESDRLRDQKIEIPHQAEILKYCKEWRNLYAIAGKFDSFTPAMRGYLRQLEHEGLLVSNDEDYRASAGYPGGDWLNKERQIVQECFWVELEFVGNLIRFWVGEDKVIFGKDAREPISFEVPRNYIKTQVRKRPQLSPVDYAGAWVNIHKSNHLSLSVHEQRDEIYFVDNENKLLFFSKYDIEKTLKVDDEISHQEFFLAKSNEKELKKSDRVAIVHYQFGLLEELGNDWAIASIKYPWCEIWRGDGCGDNYQKLPIWRIQKCNNSNTANSSEELAVSPSPSETISQTESEQPDIVMSMSQRSPSTPTTSQMSPSTETSEPISPSEENLTSLPSPSPVREHQAQATAKGSSIQNQPSGEKDSGLCAKSAPNTLSGNSLWELSIADYEQSLADAEWQDIKQKLKSSALAASGRHITAKDYLSLPTLTANAGTANSRPSGSSKLEQKFVQLGLTPNGSKLSVPAMAMLMGYPSDWLEVLTLSKPSTQPASQKAKGGSKAESSSEKPSRPHKQGSHSQGCATSKGSQEDENILPTPAPIIEQRFEIELLSGEKVERGIGGLLNHLVEGAPLNQFEIGAIAYIEKQYRGELFEGKISRIFEKEYRDKVTPGDLVKIDDRHCDAGSIYEVSSTRGGYITTKEGLCFHPDRYEPFNPVGRKLKIDSQHPTLSDRIVEVESYKDGHVKIVGGGFVAIDMVSVTSDALSLPKSHQRCSELAEESPVEEQPTNDNQQPKGNILPAISAKAISLWQPWASLIGKKQKLYETRSWATDYRGKILICSAKRAKAEQLDKWIELSDRYDFKEEFKQLPLGYAIAIADLSDCILMDEEFIKMQSELERDCGDWQPERYAWKLDNIIPIDPQPIRGYQGLWNVDIAPYLPAKKKRCDPAEVSSAKERAPRKRGRKPGSLNKKPASGYLYPRKDCQNYIYEYWDNTAKKKRCLSVKRDLGARVERMIKDGESVGEIIKFIKGGGQLALF